MDTMASQITSLAIVYSIVYSGADQRKHQSSASLAFVGGIHWWLGNSPRKWPVTRKLFPFDDVIMILHGRQAKVPFILHSWCCGYYWFGDAEGQGIDRQFLSNHPRIFPRSSIKWLNISEFEYLNFDIYLCFIPSMDVELAVSTTAVVSFNFA